MFEEFRPLDGNILVKLMDKENVTKGGIFIPTEAQEKNQIAYVIHPGNSKQLAMGDKIYYKKYLGAALDESYVVLKEEEILGVL